MNIHAVSDEELKEFMNEIEHIYNTGVQVTIIQCDTKIHDISEYKGKKTHKGFKVFGRGGKIRATLYSDI